MKMRKPFGENPRERYQTFQNQFQASISDESSDLIRAKRMRFKEAEAEANHSPSHRFDDCSAPCELTEAPQSSSEAKTTEYGFFKKLKQDLGHNSHPNPSDKESTFTSSFRTSNNLGEMGSSKYKNFKSSFYDKKSKPGGISYFSSPKDAILEDADMTKKVHQDCNRFKSPALIKMPSTINLDSLLSNTDATAKPAQCDKEDIFSFKRLKLKQQILKTLFPEADEPPKELGQSENLHLRRGEVEDKFQSCHSPNSNVQFKKNWGTSRKFSETEDSHFLDNGVSTTWSHKFRERLPSCQIVEEIDHSAFRNVDNMLLGCTRNDEDSFSDGIKFNPEPWSDGIRDGNLFMWNWRNEGYDDYSTKSWSNRFQERNLLKWSNDDYDYDYPKTCTTDTNIIKNDVHNPFSHDDVGSSHSYKVRDWDHSYGNSNGLYGSIVSAIDDRPEYDVKNREVICSDHGCDSAVHGLERYRSSEPSDRYNYAELNHSNDFELRREPRPLLLYWRTHELDTQNSSYTIMELDSYAPSSTHSKDHFRCLESDTQMEACSSHFSCSNKFQDHHMQRFAPLPLSYCPQQLNQSDDGFFRNISRDSHLFLLPEKHISSMDTLVLPQSSDSDQGLKFDFLTGFSEKQHTNSSDDVLLPLGQGNPNAQLLDNENISKQENWSLMCVHSPLLPRQVKWIDADSETSYDDSG